MWVGRRGRLDTKGETLLQELAVQERALVSKVENAKKEAAQIIEKAKQDAAKINEGAVKEAQSLSEKATSELNAEAETARQAILNDVATIVESINVKAKANQDKAVALLMKRVLP